MAETSLSRATVTTFDTGAVLADEVANWLLRLALGKSDNFRLCLSGGSTPKTLYQRLSEPPFRTEFPWARTLLFFGDERFVPATDKDSNFHMVSEALLDHVDIPRQNVFRINTDLDTPAEAARAYEATLKGIYGRDTLDAGRAMFDVTLLGLGPDGHTASLLPDQAVLEERKRWAAEVSKGRPEARVTLTYPVLEASTALAFLVVGADKRDMLAHVRSGATDVPAGRLRTDGEVYFFTDRAAVGLG